jgi:D-alanyl-D-alanine carboxypeptidase (penicillin-binding protein 5/6)
MVFPSTSRFRLVILTVMTVLVGYTGPVRAMDTQAKHAFLVDVSTDTVLLDKNAEQPTAPASMAKMMTVLLVFDRLKQGTLHMDDMLPVTENAWRMGGSKMFVMVGTKVSVHDLLQGVIVQSGNDACIVLAEAIAGSEKAFARLMNDRAKSIGMLNTHFVNATGWPDPELHSTVRDLAILADYIIKTYPEFYQLFGEKEFTWNGIRQGNRNPLLYDNIGVDGLKTGHTEEAGYSLTASAARDGRRIILVVNGLPSEQARADECKRLIEWAFREFKDYTLFRAGQPVDQAPVWLGGSRTVPLVVANDLKLTLPAGFGKERPKVVAHYTGPIPAPIRRGQQVGVLQITAPGMPMIERPLVAGADVERLGPVGRIFAAAHYLLWGGG